MEINFKKAISLVIMIYSILSFVIMFQSNVAHPIMGSVSGFILMMSSFVYTSDDNK